MKSLVLKHSIIIGGHKTSVSLENQFWNALKDIADRRGTTLSALVSEIDQNRKQGNLSSAIRLYVLENTRSEATEKVHDVVTPVANFRNTLRTG
jgi:predicted DNA-binding ribbon-helix-helix protein